GRSTTTRTFVPTGESTGQADNDITLKSLLISGLGIKPSPIAARIVVAPFGPAFVRLSSYGAVPNCSRPRPFGWSTADTCRCRDFLDRYAYRSCEITNSV